jgi:peptide/nickel transport system substrate-binding protein
VQIITYEAYDLETQIVGKMLERLGLDATIKTLSVPEFFRKTFIPLLDKSPEKQEWDIAIAGRANWSAYTAVSFLTIPFLEEAGWRWIRYNSTYEDMWARMIRTTEVGAQKARIQEIERYVYEQALCLFIYSPISIYAVNQEVNCVPYKSRQLCLKETSVTDNHWSVRGKNN